MKNFIAFIILAAVTAIYGCAFLLTTQDKAATEIAKGIDQYCKNTDAAFRTKFRDAINAKAAPNVVEVTCK